MKIRDGKRSRVAGPKGDTEGQQADTTPAVIALPDGTADAAKAAMEASDVPLGPTEPVGRSDSGALYEAATNPAKALAEPEVRTIPSEPEDAEFEEVPNTEAEQAAAALLQQMEDDEPDAKATVWTPGNDPIENVFANKSYELISEGGQKLLNWLSGVKAATVSLSKKLWVRVVAFGNDVVDAYMKLGTAAWKLHDSLKKNPTAPYLWMKRQEAKLVKFTARSYAALQAWLAERRKGGTNEAIRELSQAILDLKATHEKEIKLLCKRLNTLESSLTKNNRAVNRLANNATPIDTDQLTTLLKAASQNRKVDVMNLVQAITGGSLADSKAIVEAATVN